MDEDSPNKVLAQHIARDFVMLFDWAKIWNRQAGGYMASDTALLMLRCDAIAHKFAKCYPELECFIRDLSDVPTGQLPTVKPVAADTNEECETASQAHTGTKD